VSDQKIAFFSIYLLILDLPNLFLVSVLSSLISDWCLTDNVDGDTTSVRNVGKLQDSVGFEVSTAVVMKSLIFWDVTPCSLLIFEALLVTCWFLNRLTFRP
jgi:hypothetical protein